MLNIANTLADIAAEIALSYFRKENSFSLKEGLSPVTRADLEIEAAIREYLSKHLPRHGIVGEEYDNKESNSEYTWVIDPIDGTASFACGKPTFCTLIALLKNEKPILGIIDQPFSQERWLGLEGQQSTLNGVACFCNSIDKPGSLKLSCTTPDMFKNPSEEQKFATIKNLASIISFGGDAYSYGLLTSGCIDIIFEADLKYYDVAALIPIIEGAGGIITDWEGNTLNLGNFNGTVLASCNLPLHKKILQLMNEKQYEY